MKRFMNLFLYLFCSPSFIMFSEALLSETNNSAASQPASVLAFGKREQDTRELLSLGASGACCRRGK